MGEYKWSREEAEMVASKWDSRDEGGMGDVTAYGPSGDREFQRRRIDHRLAHGRLAIYIASQLAPYGLEVDY